MAFGINEPTMLGFLWRLFHSGGLRGLSSIDPLREGEETYGVLRMRFRGLTYERINTLNTTPFQIAELPVMPHAFVYRLNNAAVVPRLKIRYEVGTPGNIVPVTDVIDLSAAQNVSGTVFPKNYIMPNNKRVTDSNIYIRSTEAPAAPVGTTLFLLTYFAYVGSAAV